MHMGIPEPWKQEPAAAFDDAVTRRNRPADGLDGERSFRSPCAAVLALRLGKAGTSRRRREADGGRAKRT
jgi:hypothetical protein